MTRPRRASATKVRPLLWSIRMQTECDAVHMLTGWEASRGANVEHFLAEVLGQSITYEARS